MARVVKPTNTAKPGTRGRKPGRPVSVAAKTGRKAAGTAKVGASAGSRRVLAAAVPAPKLSKDELRTQVEKLERANTTLRARSREASRTAKDAAARIAELEKQVARLDKTAAAQAGPIKGGRAAAASGGGRHASREIDPGDAVPPGVAVEEPVPMDEEALTARENLQEHLGGE